MSKKATSALQLLKNNFQEARAASEKQPIDIHEIGVTAFCYEVLTAFRKANILNALQKEGQIEFCVALMINCLIDEDGATIFNKNDKTILLKECNSEVIERVGTEISSVIFGDEDPETVLTENDGDDVTDEEKAALKNSKTAKT